MKTARTLRIVLLFASLCGMPAGTSAQSSQPQEPQAVGWIFTPAVGFGGAWDNNILLANTGDNPPGDYATPLNPAADLDYRGRRTRLSTGYEGAFLLYRTFDELNSTEQHAHATLEQRLTERLTLFGEETFAQVPTTDALLLSGVPFYRVGSRMNEVRAGLEAQLTKVLALRGRYSLSHVTFADDSPAAADLQGGHSQELVVGLDRLLSPRLTIGAQFEARRAVITGDIDGFDSNTASLGLEYDITPSLTVSGLAGVSRLGAGVAHDAEIGPAVRASITQRARHLVVVRGIFPVVHPLIRIRRNVSKRGMAGQCPRAVLRHARLHRRQRGAIRQRSACSHAAEPALVVGVRHARLPTHALAERRRVLRAFAAGLAAGW